MVGSPCDLIRLEVGHAVQALGLAKRGLQVTSVKRGKSLTRVT